jgi:hypothetical protein
MKKNLFMIVLVVAMAATVAPAWGAQYIFVTFSGWSDDIGGEQTFRLFLEYEASSDTQLDIKGTLLAFDTWDNPPAKLTGTADIESDGTVDSFNVTGGTSNTSYTYDFDFSINPKTATVTMTFTIPKAFGGTTTTEYVFYGSWVIQSIQ